MLDKRVVIFASTLCIAVLASAELAARDWPQWGGRDGRNMASDEKGLPDSFVPGQKSPQGGGIDLATTKNVRWVARLGSMVCSTPAVAGGKIFIGTADEGQGRMLALDEQTGRILWRWQAPARDVPKEVDGRKMWFNVFPRTLGVCSSPAVDGDRVYFVTHRCEAVCLDSGSGKVLWQFDMWEHGSRPSDACNCSVLVHGDLVYVGTSNGVDRDADARKHDEFRKPPAPQAASLIVLDKRTGRLVAEDDAQIGPRVLHGQWSSPSLGRVGQKTLVFLGGGDGVCYAFEALDRVETLDRVPPLPVKLKKVWSFDCNPLEYRVAGKGDPVTYYCLGDRRRSDTLNKNDGTFVGMSEIIATPVFCSGRVYVALGRDPEHGRGRGALYAIDATRTGDITATGKIWTYQGLDRTLSTVSVADGLLYAADVAGRLHCLDVETGKCYWVHETGAKTWGSTLAADGRIYLPTEKHLWILAAGKERKVLDKVSLGSPLWATPVAANGVLYVASTRYLWAVSAGKK